TLTIVVSDVNDNAPVYANSFTNVSFVESLSTPTTLASLPATDIDLGANAVIDYAIASGNTDNLFTYNANGDLILSSPADYETTQYYELVLTATDRGATRLTTTTIVYVTVQNANDNVLTITPSSGTVSLTLPEDTPVGDTVVQVAATDADLGTDLSYGFVFGNDQGYLSVNPHTGAVYLVQALDREALSSLTVGVEINSTQGESATATLSIIITDVNDNDPSFSLGNYVFEVPNNTTAGTDVGALTVADSDVTSPNNVVTLSIESGDTNSRFSFNGQTLRAADTLNADTQNLYNLVVIAVDGGSTARTSTAYVTVHVAAAIAVTQVNKYDPVFTQDTYSWTVSESAAVGTQVGTLSADDADKGDYGLVSYALESTSTFTVDSTTGAVTLNSALEYSTAKSYNLFVTATDTAGNSSRTSTAALVISVTDVNNHAPVFSGTPYTVTVPETTATGTAFFVMKAGDLDSGAFGTVSYSIASGNDEARFAIDSSSGALSLATALDFETTTQYVLTILGSDGGNPSLTGTATITIGVLDENDNAPIFANSRLDLRIGSDATAMSTVTTVAATDADT
ncbi:hypothetical protein EGW08_006440, partial [Elysia chlorotica]